MAHSARVALITGSAKPDGIGAGAARALIAAGVTVVLSDLQPKGLTDSHSQHGDIDGAWKGIENVVEELERGGGTASYTIGDVSSEADAQRMVDEVMQRYGRIDILVNNAGAPQGLDRNYIEDVPLEAWERVMAVNVRGVFLMSRAAVVPMRKAGWGRIINISSATAYRPHSLKRACYAASKAAVIGFTKSLSIDVAAAGITVNAVAPGPIKTSRTLSTVRREYSTEVQGGMEKRIGYVPVGRHGHPEEVGAAIAFLASDAASYVTGQALGVNGGSAGSM